MFEKLLLHILIVIFPVLFYNFLHERKQETLFRSSYIYGTLQSLAAVLCMSFPLVIYGFQWDFRYVPMILSFLYGGPLPGCMVVLSILGMRTIIGGENLMFGYIECLLSAAIPLLFVRKFWSWAASVRQSVTVAVSGGTGLISLAVVYVITLTHPSDKSFGAGAVINMLLIGGMQIAGAWLASVMNEQTIERSMMRDKIQQAEKLNILPELAASVAHEIRNPLTVVKGFLQLIDEHKGQYSEQYTKLILSELGRAESIINDYLNFAKPEMKKVELLSLTEIANETVLLLTAYAAQSGVTLEAQTEELISVRADKGQLKQVLVNLLKNGIEATPTGGTVRVTLSHTQRTAVVTITDNGKGMSKEQLSRLGTLFYTTKDKGTGLGTMVSLRIVESIGGRIAFASKPAIGTKVTVTLPLNTHS